VNEQEIELVIVQLELDFDVGGEATEVLPFFILYDLVGEGDGDGAVGFFVVGLVGTAAVVAGPPMPKS